MLQIKFYRTNLWSANEILLFKNLFGLFVCISAAMGYLVSFIGKEIMFASVAGLRKIFWSSIFF